jgi:hypothetical protein
VYNEAVNREGRADQFPQYARSVHGLVDALNAYPGSSLTLDNLAEQLATHAAEYFDATAKLIDPVLSGERDPETAWVLTSMIGVDMMVTRRAALLAWYVDETDEQPGRGDKMPTLQPAELADFLPGPDDPTEALLAEIGGTAPPPVTGASGGAQTAPFRSVGGSVHRILDTAGDDLEGFLTMGATALLGAIAAAAPELWKHLPAAKDVIPKHLRWLAGKAVDAALEKLRWLLDEEKPEILALVAELAAKAHKATLKAGLTDALGRILDEKEVVDRADGRLALRDPMSDKVIKAVAAAERTADDHKHWRWWFPWVRRGGKFVVWIPGLPGKRPVVVTAAFVMIALSTWLAATFSGSSKLSDWLRFGIRGIPEVVERNL